MAKKTKTTEKKDWRAIQEALEARIVHKRINGIDYYRCRKCGQWAAHDGVLALNARMDFECDVCRDHGQQGKHK